MDLQRTDYMPVDHLPQTLSDAAILRRNAEIDHRKTLFRQARCVPAALRSITDRQQGGGLTRADGHILSLMIL